MKELSRAISEHDEHMERYKSCVDAHRAEKLMLDMKDHLGKVIRLRHQIKAWLDGKEVREEPIRDKKDALVQLKEQAEERMEDFDKEMRSKKGNTHSHGEKEELTEEEQANLDNQAWVREVLQKVRDRKEELEGELEMLKKKSASGKKKELLEEEKAKLGKKIEACNFHIFHLELMLRGLDNHVIDPYDVDSVRFDLEQFFEDEELDENVYDPLDLASRLGVLSSEVHVLTAKATPPDNKKIAVNHGKGHQSVQEEKSAANEAPTPTKEKPATNTPSNNNKADADFQRYLELQKQREEELKQQNKPRNEPTPTTNQSNSSDASFQQYVELQRKREEELRSANAASKTSPAPNNKPAPDTNIDESKLQSMMLNRAVQDRNIEIEIARQQEELERLRLAHMQQQQQQQAPQSQQYAPAGGISAGTPKADNKNKPAANNPSDSRPPGQRLPVTKPADPVPVQPVAWTQGPPRLPQQPPSTQTTEVPWAFRQPPPEQQKAMHLAEQQRMQQQLYMLEQRQQQQYQAFQQPQQQFQQMMDQQRRYQMMLDQQKQYQMMQEQEMKQQHQQFLVVQQEQQRRQQAQLQQQQLFLQQQEQLRQEQLRPQQEVVRQQKLSVLPQLQEPLAPVPHKEQSSLMSLFSKDQPLSPFVQQQLARFTQGSQGSAALSTSSSPVPSPTPSPPPEISVTSNVGSQQATMPLTEDEQLLISLDAGALLESVGVSPSLTDVFVKSAVESGARSDIAEASLGLLAINLHRNGIPVDARQKIIKALSTRKGGPK